MKAIRTRARAKVNLTLEVLGRRPDGYHEIRSVMALISLADEIRVAKATRWRTVVRPPLGIGIDREIATRAARALAQRVGTNGGVSLSIRKRVPPASGLGGGSSDAGATLRALARLWRIEEPATLHGVAAEVGSDVPFFLDGPCAEVRGRGEEIIPLDGGPWDGVLVLPRCRVSTTEAFARVPRASWSDGARTAELSRLLSRGPADAATLREHCFNAFDSVQDALCPEVGEIRAALGGTPMFLSGSGPSLFALCSNSVEAHALRRRVRRAGHRAVIITVATSCE